jgi:hypothetical protein
LSSQVLSTTPAPAHGSRRWRAYAAGALLVLVAVGVVLGTAILGNASSPSFDATLVSAAASPGILNPACGADALEFDLPKGWFGPNTFVTPVVQVTRTGTTIVAVSDPAASTSAILLRAFTNTCRVDTSFGSRGSEMLHVEIGGKLAHGVELTAAGAASDGGLLLGGSDDNGMIVGIVDENGEPDDAFGGAGFVHVGLPRQLTKAQFNDGPGWPTALAEAPSGEVLLGNSEGGGCCGTGWLGALSRSGQLIEGFGEQGWSRVPYFGTEDEIAQVSFDSLGLAIVLTDGAHMGSVDSDVSEFGRDGSIVGSFSSAPPHSNTKLVPPVFSAGLVIRDGNLVLVGTGQPSLVGGPLDPRASGFVLALEDKLLLVGGKAIRFSSPMLWQTWASTRPAGGYLLIGAPPPSETDPAAATTLQFTALTKDGRIDSRFGRAGRGSLTLPGLYPEAISFDPQGDGSIATTAGVDYSRIEVVELRP